MTAGTTRDRPLLLAFLLSGAAALGYELLWTRLLALALGSEALGVLGVLAGFFGGMALGAFVFHERARRSRAPVRLFAILELVAAGYALVSPHILVFLADWLPARIGPIAGDNNTPLALAITVAVAAVALLPSTLCIGATLPALVEARRRVYDQEVDGIGVGRLYAANTFGATVGILMAVHGLLPALGLAAGAVVLAGLGATSAVLALYWGRRNQVPAQPRETEPAGTIDTSRDPDPDVLRERWLLHALIFGTGLIGVGLEVVGVQVLAQVLEDTVYTFADILAVYLVGTAAGSWAYGRFAERAVEGRPATVAAVLLVILALATVVAGGALAVAPDLSQTWAPPGAPYAQHLIAEGAVAALVFFPPTLVMGALFSHLVGLLAGAGVGVGRAYALNTLGSALAPFVFGLWMIPVQGYTDSYYAVTFLYLFLLGIFMWFRRFAPRWILAAFAAVLLPFFGVAAALGTNPLILVKAKQGWKLLEQRETYHGLVMVTELEGVEDTQAPLNRRLQVGSLFRMGGAAAFAERRMGHIPLLLAPEAKSALFLGVGTGATLGAVRAYDLERIEAVELVPAVLDMLPHFSAINENIADDPKVSFHSADARRYLAASPHRYDIIVADLFHPARDGAGSLYAREHFENALDHLEPDGMFAQWLPLYQLEPDTLRAIIRTFLSVYPEVHSFLGIYNAATPCMVLLGRDPAAGNELSVEIAALSERLGRPIFKDLAFHDARDVFTGYMLDRKALADFAGNGPLNTDLHPYVLFNSPRGDYVEAKELAWNSLMSLVPRRVPVPPALIDAPPERRQSFLAEVARLAEALSAYLWGDVARAAVGEGSPLPKAALLGYLKAYRIAPGFQPARGMLIQAARSNRAAAALVLPKLVEIAPQDQRNFQEYLMYLRAIGDRERFEEVLAEAQERFPESAPPPQPQPQPQPRSPTQPSDDGAANDSAEGSTTNEAPPGASSGDPFKSSRQPETNADKNPSPGQARPSTPSDEAPAAPAANDGNAPG